MVWKFKDKTHTVVLMTYPDGSVESGSAAKHQPYLDYIAAGGITDPEDAKPLAQLQAEKKAEINAQAGSINFAKYPIWVQTNCANGIYPTAFTDQMKADITSVIAASNIATDEVMAAVDEAGVSAVIPIWPVI